MLNVASFGKGLVPTLPAKVLIFLKNRRICLKNVD